MTLTLIGFAIVSSHWLAVVGVTMFVRLIELQVRCVEEPYLPAAHNPCSTRRRWAALFPESADTVAETLLRNSATDTCQRVMQDTKGSRRAKHIIELGGFEDAVETGLGHGAVDFGDDGSVRADNVGLGRLEHTSVD